MTAPDLDVRLRAWEPGDSKLLARLLGDPSMTEHIGGPETPEQLATRHARYLDDRGPGAVFAVTIGPDATAAGWVGYWESSWGGERVWEAGWSVLPEFQGRGVATSAMRLLIPLAAAEGLHDAMHAFPAIDNAASNAVCRKVGFDLLGEVDVEYPPGRTMRGNDWRLELAAQGPSPCPECGAVVPRGGSCRDNLHRLLELESRVEGAAGGLPHFYAVASYGLQHPGSMGFAVSTVVGLRASVAGALGGADDIGYLRRRSRELAGRAGRIERRPGEAIPRWRDVTWPLDVCDVIAAGPDGYAEHVRAWAASIVAATEGRDPGR